MPIPLLIAGAALAAGGIGSTVAGHLMANGQRAEAEEILERARRIYGGLSVPNIERAAAEVLGPSAFETLKRDMQYEQAKRQALGRLGDVVNSEGYTIEDRAVQNEFLNNAARAEAANRAAISEQMVARGIGGSGAEIGMMFANAQASADRNSKQTLSAAAEARRRYIQSVLAQGQMAGQFARDDYGQQAQAAQARDYIDRWNAESRERARQFNAQQQQMQFQNQMGLADRRYGVERDRAAARSGQAQATQQMWSGIGSGMLQMGGTLAAHGLSQPSSPPPPAAASAPGQYGPMASAYAAPNPYANSGYQPWSPDDLTWRPA